MTLLVPTVLLSWALAATPDAPIRLQALTATSGTGAAALLDGDDKTGWQPEGDALDEGVLLRFEEPTRIDGVEIASCGVGFQLAAFVNGRIEAWGVGVGARATQTFRVPGKAPRVQSLFLRFVVAKGTPCLGEVRFLRDGARLAVLPPRQVTGRVSATSTLSPAPAYHPSFLFDSRLDFGWVEGSKGSGEGEAVTVELDAPIELTALELWNGYQRSPVHFEKNARARKVTVSLDGGAPIPFELKDARGAQKLTLAAPTKASRIRLAIESVYKGSKYTDMVLSELRLWDGTGPLGVATKDREELRAALLTSVKGTAVERLLGRRLSNVCPDTRTRTMKLRADHTFVMYEDVSEADGSWKEVLDGTWVFSGKSRSTSEIEIFGRRHRADDVWDPYSEQPHKVKETDRIAGGKLKVVRVSGLSDAERAAASASVDVGDYVRSCLEGQAGREAVAIAGTALTDTFFVGDAPAR